MCGIWGKIIKKNVSEVSDQKNNQIKADADDLSDYSNFEQIKSRGPDVSKLLEFKLDNAEVKLGFHRLAIIDVNGGEQPIVHTEDYQVAERVSYTRKVIVLCNGEIYNFENLKEKYSFNTKSDCHVILDMYLRFGIDRTCKELNGEFAFCVIDILNNHLRDIYLCRDRFGIRPLFYHQTEHSLVFSSELKGIQSYGKCKQFQPRIYSSFVMELDFKENQNEYYKISSNNFEKEVNNKETAYSLIREYFEKSVRDRLQSERPIGSLLSGGLDSSLVSAIASKILREKNMKLRTFAIGMHGSPDLKYAKMVADYIQSDHTEIIIPVEEWVNSLNEVIRRIETHDVTTIRASTGQYLIGKWISENTDIKVVLNGDGSDEVCAGYLYFFNAPNAEESNKENIRLLSEIHFYDVLRVDRAISGHGLEARVPFLEHNFVDLYLSLNPEWRVPIKGLQMEKQLLRDAFKSENLLPDEVLYRKKEAFSDGVSSMQKSWYQIIEESIDENKLSDISKYKYMTPLTKESHYFRDIFEELYPDQAQVLETGHYWLPKWSGNIINPSARVLSVYSE